MSRAVDAAHVERRKQAPRVDLVAYERYLGTLLDFQDWCETHGITFREGISQALETYKQCRKGTGGPERNERA
jgi:hypothetical protein